MSTGDSTSLSTKLLMLGAALSVGYLVTSAYYSIFPPKEAVIDHSSEFVAEALTPEALLAQASGGMDLPEDVKSRMLGEPPPPAREPKDSGISNKPNYSFLIAAHAHEQIEEMRDYLKTPEGQKQEDGVTPESVEAMAREGRMNW